MPRPEGLGSLPRRSTSKWRTLQAHSCQNVVRGRREGLAISNAIVGLLRDRAGRGPTQAKTAITFDLVLVTLRDCLTTGERTLAENGQAELVRRARDLLHQGLRAEASATVEAVTGREVVAFLTDRHADPDVAIMAFTLGSRGDW